MFFRHTKCRACTSTELVSVFDLGLQPLANGFRAPHEEQPGFAPLEVMYCPRCTLAQLSVTVKPEILYANYPYVTSKSDTMKRHFALLLDYIHSECTPEVVAEIGSNDGDFLKFCKDNGTQRVIGIDPASNLADVAKEKGVGTIRAVFNYETAGMASMSVPPINAIVARHVFCHTDDWVGFMKGLDRMATADTAIFIEVPYVMDTLRNVEFDTIYHEHLSYLSIKSMLALLECTPFKLCKVRRFNIHGGAIVMLLRRRDNQVDEDGSIGRFVEGEYDIWQEWKNMATKSWGAINNLKSMVGVLNGEGKAVCGFGASAKSTVWINACGFSGDDLKFICDSTPSKQGKASPGSSIPIVDEGALLREMPDYAIMGAWNFRNEILEKQIEYRNRGGKFIIPVPKLEIV